jgi:ABC-type nitrate/sulfonate/bicarbonate transport system permease component
MRRLDGPVPFRGGGFSPRERWSAGAATLVTLIACWQFGTWAGFIPTLFLPSPVSIAVTLWRLAVTGVLWTHLSASLGRLLVGWVAGTIFGVATGVAAGLWSVTRSPVMAVVAALFPIPKIALVPLFIIWFGIGEGSKIATIGLGVFFPTVIATMGGVDNVPRGLIRMGQSFGLPTGTIIRAIIFPGAAPAILNGFRVTASIAIVLLVAAEMIGAEQGIGAFVLSAGNLYDTDALMAGIVVLSALGLTVAGLIGALERVLLRWR